MALHVGLYLVVLGAVIFNRYLSFFVLALMLVGIVFVLGVTGLISWGLTGFGIPTLIICCILCTMLFGMHAGIASAVLGVISVGIIGTAFYLNHLSLKFDPSLYLNSLSAWAAGIIGIIMSAGLIVIALGSMNNQFVAMIKKLEREIQDRERLTREKTELQTKLQRAQKMEVVANVAGGVAHDLNNVLAGVLCYPDLLMMELPPDSPLRNTLKKMKK